jgi:hypothetical protein
MTAAAVLLVAGAAAVVSFVHIERLAVTRGQTWLAAVLLPVSIDGTVAAASLRWRLGRLNLTTVSRVATSRAPGDSTRQPSASPASRPRPDEWIGANSGLAAIVMWSQ